MPRFPARPALALLGALLCLAACAPTATVSVVPTATTPPAPTATLTPVLAPTPTNVPAGWKVLTTTHFSLAYPSGWTAQTYPLQDGAVPYTIDSPDNKAGVGVLVRDHVPDPNVGATYCLPASDAVRHTTLAGLPMTFYITGEGMFNRTWAFANAQRTVYLLSAGDAQSSSATQAQDVAILATFRPDNATPWSC